MRRIEDVEFTVTAIGELVAVASAERLGDHKIVVAAHRWLQVSVNRVEQVLDLAVVGARVAAPSGIVPCECGATAWTRPTGWATTHEPAVECAG